MSQEKKEMVQQKLKQKRREEHKAANINKQQP